MVLDSDLLVAMMADTASGDMADPINVSKTRISNTEVLPVYISTRTKAGFGRSHI
jgi:hypothetical protein